MPEHVILVDENDYPLGVAEKMKAHSEGKLHRAFSVFVFNDAGEMLLQRRALGKYHSAGLWTNTCCSHPRAGESVEAAATRRLCEEMGFECTLHKIFHFVYKATLERALIEHEFDHVFFGRFNGQPRPNPQEVMDWRWLNLPALEQELKQCPENYTVWFKLAMPRVVHARNLMQ